MADSGEQPSRFMFLRSDGGPTQTNPTINPALQEDMAGSGEQNLIMPLRSDGGVTQTNPTIPPLTVVRSEFTDLECLDLADLICPDNDFHRLGHYLGFNAPALNRYRRENTGGGCHGVYKMLVDWKKRFLVPEQRENLANALDNAVLKSLAFQVRYGQKLEVVAVIPPNFSSQSSMSSTSNVSRHTNPPRSLHSYPPTSRPGPGPGPGPEVNPALKTTLPCNTEPSPGNDVQDIDLFRLSRQLSFDLYLELGISLGYSLEQLDAFKTKSCNSIPNAGLDMLANFKSHVGHIRKDAFKTFLTNEANLPSLPGSWMEATQGPDRKQAQSAVEMEHSEDASVIPSPYPVQHVQPSSTPGQLGQPASSDSQATTEAEKNNYDNLPEKAQSDVTDGVESTDHATEGSSATGHFGALGGKLSTKSHGFTLHIPPGALEADEKIGLRVLTEIPNGLTLQEDELLVSHGFQCYPSGLRFKKPAKLMIPHCALVTAPNTVQTILYSWNQSGTPKRLPDSSNFICLVQKRWLEVSVSHFSGGFIAFIWDWLFLKGILLSCMSFLPRLLPLSRKPILEVRFIKKLHVHDQEWNDVHALKDPNFQPVKGDDDEVVFERRTLTVACHLGEKNPKSEEHTIQHSDLSLKSKVTRYFPLDLTEESDETLVTLEVVQTSTQTIKFNTRFQEHDTPSLSTAEIHTETREHAFDDLLKTIAKQIHKNDDIDSLGGQLGFEPPEIQRYIQINEKYHDVTCMGTLSMLRDWRNRTKRSEEHAKLKKALIAIKHSRLADDLLKDNIASSELGN